MKVEIRINGKASAVDATATVSDIVHQHGVDENASGVAVAVNDTVVPKGEWATRRIAAGDVVVIPAGTGHWFTKIDDHIDYLMIRIDPDKVTPLKNAEQSKEYLSKPAPTGGQ